MTKIADQMGVEVKEDAWTEKKIKKKKIRNEKTEFFEWTKLSGKRRRKL